MILLVLMQTNHVDTILKYSGAELVSARPRPLPLLHGVIGASRKASPGRYT